MSARTGRSLTTAFGYQNEMMRSRLSIMSTRGLLLCWVLAGVGVALPLSVNAQSVARTLAETRHSACLEDVVPMLVDEMENLSLGAFLDSAGRRRNMPASWTPGNDAYDKALGLLQQALTAARVSDHPLFSMTSVDFLEMGFTKLSRMRQSQVAVFLGSPEGKIYWEYIADAATCEHLIVGLEQRKAKLMSAQDAKIQSWRPTLASKHEEFERIYAQLSPSRRREFDEGAQTMYASMQRAPDEAFQERFTSQWGPALVNIVRPIWPSIDALMK